LHDNERYVNVEKGRWRILFVRGHKRRAEEDAAKETNTVEALHVELTSRGVHHQVASDLVSKHPMDRIRAKIEVFDWLVGHSDQHVARNPAGYLVASIRDDYSLPDDFIPKLRKARKHQADDKLKVDTVTDDTEAKKSHSPAESITIQGTRKKPGKHDLLADPETEKRLTIQWEALPESMREEISEEVNQKHGGLLRWPALMLPLYLERLHERFGFNSPVSDKPVI
jgi:hypothetical protein